MTENQKKVAAKEFAEYWKGKGYEKGESQSFWLSLLRDVLGVEHPETYVKFEQQAKIDKNNGFIDVVIPSTLGGYPVTIISNDAFEDCLEIKRILIASLNTAKANNK